MEPGGPRSLRPTPVTWASPANRTATA